ncbi:CelD/BcsL family acetyltransferase involved in cellulose biosynthesis [Rhodoblastus acidophilus]|uniref:GNAT family N-acetyltransferase n=1 Tax=Rhodoblastus acidophilus TaxID=1074 RepID=UPI0022254807|nr:GNAT family N-acetyltransferase [Rhodoblastus acidophilus]MCW2285217.1 CelD/BcsL family acetyltransferase involved in cellulose biosynthesis [Rhodoblastus acidophilus]MCW2334173.1 CelD/BcsL family acetyltransferase involved in cellulose biosynthesis [Rhodoblastus acidophilus]
MTDSSWPPAPFLNGFSPGAEDRPAPAPLVAPLLARAPDEQDGPLLDCLGLEGAQACAAEWEELAARALAPNIFLEPDFALNAARHIAGAKKPEFLFCWEGGEAPARGRLLGVWPLSTPRPALLARGWTHVYSCSGAPLLDRVCAPVVLERMLAWMNHRRLAAVRTRLLPKTHPAYAALEAHAARAGLTFALVEEHDRAALDATQLGVSARDFISRERRKKLRRRAQRLRDHGAVAFHVAEAAEDLREQIEAFMLLEVRGWKGRKGTAFLSDPGHAAFLRAMSRTLGRQGKCRVFWLSLDGRMIAANIILQDGRGGAYFWKTAYDEDFASMSPGALLTMDMTDRLLADKSVAFVDSCAIPNHPMIDHLWRERLRVADVMLAVAPDRPLAFAALLHSETLLLTLREKTKSALARLGLR